MILPHLASLAAHTLALQEVLDDEPCLLAQRLIRDVNTKHLLDFVPCEQPAEDLPQSYTDTSHDTALLFRKTVLLVLKSVAVTVKEARGDSSSSSSEDSSPKSATQGSDTEEAEMEIICKSLQEVLAKTDAFVKRHKDYHPNCPIAEWMVKLFSSHDDWMVEAMLVKRSLSSAESLQKAGSNTNINLHAAVQTMFTLRHSLKKLVAKELFPYNIAPILRLLDQCNPLFGAVV
ncbi:hypothetical protein HAZT_HAZT005389 [Hyalella azteca]|uniref:Uncharacterized protein n=1 Tax=Hyalella azteca TaxID=294128 RepID=A0A6A0HB85_HYAAZ|nr:hypothetical protein HAZT_HAZT005389 [Hyalella azteca]